MRLLTNTRANVRLAPDTSTAGNIIGVLNAGKLLDANPVDGEWFEVRAFIHKDTVRVLPDPIPLYEDWQPAYASQWDTDGNARRADCGQACCAMLARARGIEIAINDFPFQSGGAGHTNATDLVKNLAFVGIPALEQYVYADALLKTGDICLISYSGLHRSSVQDTGFYGWHWVVFREYADDGVVVNDPDYKGARRSEGEGKFYSLSEWKRAFIAANPRGRVIVRMIDVA